MKLKKLLAQRKQHLLLQSLSKSWLERSTRARKNVLLVRGMWCKVVCGIEAKSPGVHCERFKLISRLASDAIEGVCSCTWAIIGCVGGTTVWICGDCRGVRISSRWTCCFASGRRANQREVTIQAKRKLNNTQIKASWVGVTVFGTSMGYVPLSRLFAIKKL